MDCPEERVFDEVVRCGLTSHPFDAQHLCEATTVDHNGIKWCLRWGDAPVDDEPETDEERAAVAEARADIRAGRTRQWAEARAEIEKVKANHVTVAEEIERRRAAVAPLLEDLARTRALLEQLRAAWIAYDAAIQKVAERGEHWIDDDDDELDRLYAVILNAAHAAATLA